MSSPKILVGVPMPLDEAKRVNRSAAARYLNLARTLYASLVSRSSTLRAEGVAVPMPAESPDDIVRRVEAEIAADHSWDALQLAHAYWQSLKHGFGDAIDSLEVAALERRGRESESESAQDVELRREVARQMAVSLPATSSRLESLPNPVAIDRVAERITAVLGAASACGESAALGIERILASASSAGERCLALDVLYAAYSERASRTRREQAVARVRHERTLREREAARTMSAALRDDVADVAQSEISVLHDRLDAFDEQIDELDGATLDSVLAEIQHAVGSARARKSTFDLVAATLRRQGYEEVGAMETLTPRDIRRYFRDPEGEDHLVTLDATIDGGTVAVEAVRIAAGRDSDAVRADRETQQRLCNVLAGINERSGASWRIETIVDVAPGAPIRQRPDLVIADGEAVVVRNTRRHDRVRTVRG